MPITVHVGPWHAIWNGGRLMDIYHAERDGALECVQVGAYDWERGELIGTPTRTDLRNRLADWVRESGADFTRELPYL